MSSKYSGSEWLISQHKELSPIGVKVADILGQAFLGIYHIDRDALRADWANPYYITFTISALRDWSTFDNDTLMVMIVLCHNACIRMEIHPAGPRYFRFLFHQRTREGGIYERMPTIEDHVKFIQEHYALGGQNE